MQRAKHAERRKETRKRLELGEAVEAAGASHLSRSEIIAVLTAHMGSSDRVVSRSKVGAPVMSDQTRQERSAV